MEHISTMLPQDGPEKIGRIKQFEKPEKPVYFNEWQKVIKNNFPDLLFPAEIGLSIIAQILIKEITNPFALVLVDVPAAGKTIVVNFFDGIEGLTYATDKFTPASFVTNSPSVSRDQIEKVDLLPRIRYKMFLLRDMATMFSKKEEHLTELLGLLTRVLDGEGLDTESGVHGQRGYKGEYLFMMLGASTPISPKIFKIMGNLGSRLFFLRMNSRNKTDEELVKQLKSKAYKGKETACREITNAFVKTLWSENPNGIIWNNENDPEDVMTIIARCSGLLAKLRGAVNVWSSDDWGETKYSYATPTIEKSDRINQLLYNQCRGYALVHGRKQIERSDLKATIELCFDSGYTSRSSLFRALIDYNGIMKTNEVEKKLNQSKPTALKEMNTLEILGICNIAKESRGGVGQPEEEIHLKKEFEWFISNECREIRGLSPLPSTTTEKPSDPHTGPIHFIN